MTIKIIFYRDCLDSYGYTTKIGNETLEDDKGKFKLKEVLKEVPCNCHPETCNHLEGKKTLSYTEKIYEI